MGGQCGAGFGGAVEEDLEELCVGKTKKCNKCGTRRDDETGWSCSRAAVKLEGEPAFCSVETCPANCCTHVWATNVAVAVFSLKSLSLFFIRCRWG